jgi:hypothetical protein
MRGRAHNVKRALPVLAVIDGVGDELGGGIDFFVGGPVIAGIADHVVDAVIDLSGAVQGII